MLFMLRERIDKNSLDPLWSRGLGDVYKRQSDYYVSTCPTCRSCGPVSRLHDYSSAHHQNWPSLLVHDINFLTAKLIFRVNSIIECVVNNDRLGEYKIVVPDCVTELTSCG